MTNKSRILLLILFAVSFCTRVQAQSVNSVFDKATPVTWLGLDFTQAKLIGDREKYGSTSDVKFLMDRWNDLIVAESDKYDVAHAIGRSKVENMIDITKNMNSGVDPADLFSDKSADDMHLKASDIQGIVGNYDFGNLSGVGLIFIIESFNKINEQGSMYVTFVDMSSGQVLFTERMVAPPKGFGMRNYWAGSIYEVLNKMKKKEFDQWRKKYAH